MQQNNTINNTPLTQVTKGLVMNCFHKGRKTLVLHFTDIWERNYHKNTPRELVNAKVGGNQLNTLDTTLRIQSGPHAQNVPATSGHDTASTRGAFPARSPLPTTGRARPLPEGRGLERVFLTPQFLEPRQPFQCASVKPWHKNHRRALASSSSALWSGWRNALRTAEPKDTPLLADQPIAGDRSQ